MTQTAADRHSSFSHKSGDRYSYQQYDAWGNWLYSKRLAWGRKPTLAEFLAYVDRREEYLPDSTAKVLMDRRWATGTCRPENCKNSMGVSPQDVHGGTTEKLRFDREMTIARKKLRKKGTQS